jgi:hypothetical protein
MRWLPPSVSDDVAVSDDAADERRAATLGRALALAGLGLVATTWRLWTPQHVFPQVPFFQGLDGVPAWCQWAGAAAMVLGLVLAVFAPDYRRLMPAALLLFAAATLALVLLDQQRMQPWAYQFMLAAVVLALSPPKAALGLLRLLVISFYFHSAITKFDVSFLHTLGQQFLAALVGIFGASLDSWSNAAREVAAATFPAGELAIAVGLCFERSRGWALAGAVLLHVLLLLILGPWGLDHKPAVLVWNLFFIVQDMLLFWRSTLLRPLVRAEGGARIWKNTAPWPVRTVIFAAVLLPFLAPTTWFDLWPSWGLYASSAERVQLVVHRRELELLPAALRLWAEIAQDPDDPWLTVRLDRWSLSVLDAPIYPQNRYQLGVARAVIVRYRLVHARVFRFGLADRLTGARQLDLLTSLAKIDSAGSEYFFNVLPRQQLFAPPDDAP